MHKPDRMPQLKEWIDRSAPVVEEAREMLRHRAPSELVMYSGCEQDTDGNLRLTFFGQEYVIDSVDLTVRRIDTGDEPSSFTQSLILAYLRDADGTPSSDRWIGFRELPEGTFYAQAFQSYTGAQLVRELEGGLEAFKDAAEAVGGEPVEIGGVGYAFDILPRIRIAVVYWQGDGEFPSQARVLFKEAAANYMPTDGLAILGSRLVRRILKAAR